MDAQKEPAAAQFPHPPHQSAAKPAAGAKQQMPAGWAWVRLSSSRSSRSIVSPISKPLSSIFPQSADDHESMVDEQGPRPSLPCAESQRMSAPGPGVQWLSTGVRPSLRALDISCEK
jgi:hypothetical protein